MQKMSDHHLHRYSVTIKSNDLAVVGCLRSLAQFSQKSGNNRIPWGGTKDADWRRDGNAVTFRFTSADYRAAFLSEAERLLPKALWAVATTSDSDPATPQR
jgi:hypothetical protein